MEDVELEEYTQLKFKQLEIANNSVLLIYTRDRTDHALAKKLRPEFKKVLISTELKDCQKIISKITNETKDEAPVDVVLADFDLSMPKFVDYLNKRPSTPETNLCPLIPIIVLAKDNSVKDVEDHLIPVGGANKVLGQPFKIQTIFNILIEVLHNRKQVEDTFHNIKKVPTKSAKYPYLSIFDARPPLKAKDGVENDAKPSHTLLSQHESTVEELEDASDCSTMLPDCVRVARKEFPSLSNKYEAHEKDMDIQVHLPFSDTVKPALLKRQPSDRKQTILRQRSSKRFAFAGLEDFREEFARKEADDNRDPKDRITLDGSAFESIDMLNSNQARKESLLPVQEDSLDNSLAEDGTVTPLPVVKPPLFGVQSELLMNPLHRPIWSESADAARMIKKNGGLVLHDYASFVEKPPPELSKLSTVSGLDRKACQQLWRVVKRPLTSSAIDRRPDEMSLQRMNSQQSIDLSSQSVGTPTRPKSRTPGKGPQRSISTDAYLEPDVIIQQNRPFQQDPHRPKTPHSHLLHQSFSSFVDSNLSTATGEERHGLRTPTSGEALHAFSQGVSHDLKDMNRVYHKLATMAKQSAPDLQVSNLLSIDFSSRQINLGEKEMLERGLHLEQAGDFESASIYYARAGAHSKEQQISRMLLGSVAYRSNKLLSALRYYGLAIHLIEAKPKAMRPVQDAFLAHFNRAIIHFRLGDDDEGVKDLDAALSFNPNHLLAREILSLAKRRLGKYSQAIEEAILHKNQKLEFLEKEKEEMQKKAAEQRGKKQLERERRMTARRGSSSRGRAESDRDESEEERKHIEGGGREKDGEEEDKDKFASPGNTSSSSHAPRKDSHPHAQVVKHIVLDVPDSACHTSLQERKAEARLHLKEGAASEDSSSSTGLADGYLKVFKLQHGVKLELFQELFHKPSELQSALLSEPSHRGEKELKTISNLLQFFPFFQNLSPSVLHELAQSVEYRALNTAQISGQDNRLFGQNQDPYAVCLLLRGHVQSRLDYPVHQSMASLPLDDFYEHEVFGHIDFLFSRMTKALVKVIEDVLLKSSRSRRPTASHMITNGLSSSTAGFGGNAMVGGGMGEGESLPSQSSDEDSDVQMGRLEESDIGQALFHELHLLLHEQHPSSSTTAKESTPRDAHPPHPRLQRSGTGPSRDGGSGSDAPLAVCRAIRPGLFATYTMPSSCELLLFSRNDYFRHLFSPALEDFRLRLETLQACGIFHRWRPEEIVRLARMGRIQKKARGEVLLAQGSKPSHLYIIVRGLCKVVKKPNRTERLVQKLEIAKEKAHQHDLKYVFHHKPLLFREETVKTMQTTTTAAASSGGGSGREGQGRESVEASRSAVDLGKSYLGQDLASVQSEVSEGSSPHHSPPSSSPGRSPSPSRSPVGKSLACSSSGSGSSALAGGGAGERRTPGRLQSVSSSPMGKEKKDGLPSVSKLASPAPRTATTPSRPGSRHPPSSASSAHRLLSTPQRCRPASSRGATPTASNLPPTPSTPSSSSVRISDAPSTHSHGRKKVSISKDPHALRIENSIKEIRSFPTVVDLPPSSPTAAERERKELANEIRKLEELILQARRQDALENCGQGYGPHANRHAPAGLPRQASYDNLREVIAHLTPNAKPFTKASMGSSSLEPGEREARELAGVLGAQQAEIMTLQWPQIFGEACVIDPDSGVSRGSIIAETAVEIFVLHKKQIQTFQIDDAFLDRVKGKGVIYPGDPDIVVNLYRQQEWKQYCEGVMKGVSTSRWPKSLKASEPFTVA